MTPAHPLFFAPFLLQVPNTYEGPPGILINSVTKAAVVEVRGTCAYPHNWGLGWDTWWRKTWRQMSHKKRRCCRPSGSTTPISHRQSSPQSRPLAALLAVTGALLLTASADGNRYWNFVMQATHPVTSHFSDFLFWQAEANWTKRLLIGRTYWILNKEKCA